VMLPVRWTGRAIGASTSPSNCTVSQQTFGLG
jgi:hypothetical protein